MKYKIEVRSIWEYGQRKDQEGNPHQEDSLFPAHGQAKADDRVFILCDGMGGHEAGEVASATVCEAMSKSLLPLAPAFADSMVSDAVAAAYDALDAVDKSNSQASSKMGTTMTCLVLHAGGATMAHMGDSRIYHIRSGATREDTHILFQTRDHSLVNALVDIGEITQEEAKTHPRKNVITRALQPHGDVRQHPDIKSTVDVKAGDWFFMCSDGMLEQMDDEAIGYIFSEAAGNIDSKVEILTKATSENHDNHTAFLIHVAEVEGAQPLPKTENAPSPLMGIVEDAANAPQSVPAQPHSDIEDDKKSEVDLGDEPSDASEEETTCRKSASCRRRIPWVALVLTALVVGGGIMFWNRNVEQNVGEKAPQEARVAKDDKDGGTEKTVRHDTPARGTATAESAKKSNLRSAGKTPIVIPAVERPASHVDPPASHAATPVASKSPTDSAVGKAKDKTHDTTKRNPDETKKTTQDNGAPSDTTK